MMRSTNFGAAVTHPILSPGASTCKHMHHMSATLSKGACITRYALLTLSTSSMQRVPEKEQPQQSHVYS